MNDKQEGILFTIDCLNNQKYNFDYNLEVLIKEAKQLQSNWNSLREWLEKQKHDTEICKEWNSKNNFNDIDYDRDIKIFDFVLDKMNELERRR